MEALFKQPELLGVGLVGNSEAERSKGIVRTSRHAREGTGDAV
jgi:hypothetical protein